MDTSPFKPIAIVGIGCRLPGSITNPSQLWEFLDQRRSAGGKLPESRFNIDGYHGGKDQPAITEALGGYFIQEDIRVFDNQFFGINNREAGSMDPQQRKLLEVVFESFESAGVSLDEASGANIGCYVASFTPDFIAMQTKDVESLSRYSQIGMGTTILANRISHVFNLKGPSCVLDTACSSSLYALQAASSALLAGECDSAIVAGVNLVQTPEMHVAISQAGVISPSSTCHTFDSSADGYGRADGVNAIFIKRLDDAIRDGDPIRSIIRSVAVNSNGHTPGITQPSIDGQEAVIRKAYARAKLNPSDTPFVETHGTGTGVGDPIEVEALSRVFQKNERDHPLLLGAVKTNLGHSEAASGLTSIIKATLMLERGQIPATIGLKQLNPKLKIDDWGVQIVTSTIPLPSNGQETRRVSVNSFGYGGANAHSILESAPLNNNKVFVNKPKGVNGINGTNGTNGTNGHSNGYVNGENHEYGYTSDQTYLIPFSANKLPSLHGRVEKLSELDLSSISIRDLAYTLGQRRTHLPLRGYIVAKESSLLEDITLDNLRLSTTENNHSERKCAFVFTGQGAQYPGMSRELMQFSTFSRTIRELDDALSSLPHAPSWKIYDVLTDTSEKCPINQAEFAQTTTTAVQIGIVNLLRDWSIHPQGTVGHSSGEIGAAYAAGLLSAREAIVTAYYRGYLVTKVTSEGSMAAVGLGPDSTNEWITKLGLGAKVRVACINSPESVTISGDSDGVDTAFDALQTEGIFARKLRTDGRAYHSHHMTVIGHEYEKLLEQAWALEDAPSRNTTPEKARMFSTVICQEVNEKHVRKPSYWRTNLESPVRFSEGLTGLSKMTDGMTFVEVGPHAALKMPSLSTLGKDTSYLGTLTRGKDASVSLLSLVGDLYTQEFRVDFAALNKAHAGQAATPKVLCDLPNYPWHYEDLLWAESRVSSEARFRRHPRHELLGSEIPGGNKTTYGWRNILQLDNVPWLRDHKLGETVVFPAAGYMAMAVEALIQVASDGKPSTAASVVLRHVDLLNAMPLADENSIELYTELRPLALSNTNISKNWWQFQISSISDGVATIRAKGSIKFDSGDSITSLSLPSSDGRIAPQSKRLWYESIARGGLGFGPEFQIMDEVYTPDPKGTMYAEARTKSLIPEIQGSTTKPRYLIHPTLLDSLFQVGLISCTGGFIQSMVAKVPTRIRQATINLHPYTEGVGTIRSKSKVIGFSSNSLDAALLDTQQQTIAHFKDVDITTFAGNEKVEVRHPFLRVSWKHDVDKIKDNVSFSKALDHILSITELGCLGSRGHILAALDLLVHKNPDARILCLSGDHVLVAMALLEVLKATSHHRRFRSFSLGRLTSGGKLEVAEIRNYTMPLGLKSLAYEDHSADQYEIVILPDDLEVLKLLNGMTTTNSVFLRATAPNANSDSIVEGLSTICSTTTRSHGIQLFRKSPGLVDGISANCRNIIHVCGSPSHPSDAQLRDELSRDLGMPVQQIALADLAESSIAANALVISTVELERPVLAGADQRDYFGIQQIVEQAAKIVWVAGCGVHQGFDPTLSLFPGLARAIMIEQPSTKIFTLELDPHHASPESMSRDISAIIDQAKSPIADYEYVRDGAGLMISRAVPDDRMNKQFRDRDNAVATSLPLGNAGTAALSLQKPGQLSTAQFVKKRRHDSNSLAADHVLVKVTCIGLNAKDVYALAGRVHTTEASCSLEYTGQVVAAGSAVEELAVGDKVAVMYPGHFSTFESVPSWSCVKLRRDEDLWVMASVLVVFVTAIYALHYRAQLQPGESILIHSAAGGVGIATIQLAKLIGAEIFATVGTDEKKQYLVDNFGLQADHIFNSRDSSFVSGIKTTTAGRGVDVILNSLVGELLHESWQCLADFGRFVEIGKRDIVDGGNLNMEVLSRGTTFTAFDLSMLAESTSPAHHRLYKTMLARAMELVRSKSVQPVKPLSVFKVSEVTPAFNYFNSSKRMGKIVISFEDQTQMVPVVPDKFSAVLDPNKSYLLLGCLGGLGRSLSTWMLSRGARKFVFVGRSGTEKPAAKHLVENLEKAGASCIVIKGNVTNEDDMLRAVAAAPAPLGGVVQAAMGLNEAIFRNMSREHWLNGTEAKVKGTWNIHNALSKLDKEKELDFFIMTSSINGKVGTATESNYCAANNFLDVFARYRRSLGLQAISLGIGMVSEVGYLHENPHIEDLLLRKGIRPITEDELLQIFDFALSEPPTSAHPRDLLSHPHLLTGLEVTGLQDQHKQGYNGYWQFLDDARFSVLTCALKRSSASETASGSGSQWTAISEALDSGDKATLVTVIKDLIAKKMSNLILVPLAKLDVKTPLSDFGMDSMLAAELRQYIFSATGADVLFLTLMDKATNVMTLSGIVADKLQESRNKESS
ncbi:putative polyketide synthase [Annulohypoxylon truncatum]|uniref:putative polyketide synthase n=1 Tax=Annulohypoxylon truncatum TaxID=327061 RepID=UPI002008ADE9|nr:putative polyketide synthase [Annulohypoxylon truncatum]KAI1208447.1 putative polyketide synthase [Annulohypoxylon truncatum]